MARPGNRGSAPLPVIDLFAGPGGLGEGFAVCIDSHGKRRFRLAVSVEKDPIAHQTLELRAFFRQAADRRIRRQYYRFVRGEFTREELFTRFPREAAAARSEALCRELGSDPDFEIDDRIHEAVGKGVESVLIGGPPCQVYSLIGRARYSQTPGYRDDGRHTLYRHYLRVLATHRPAVFVMENVKGLLSARHEDQGMFARIHDDLSAPVKALRRRHKTSRTDRYHIFPLAAGSASDVDATTSRSPSGYVVRCELHGVPQRRHRVFLIGVREDIVAGPPGHLPLVDEVGAADVLRDLPQLSSGLSGAGGDADSWLRTLRSIRADSWFRRTRSSDPAVADHAWEAVETAINTRRPRGAEFVSGAQSRPAVHANWLSDPVMGGVANHTARTHMAEDLKRYLFASSFAAVHRRSPNLSDFPRDLLPAHRNVGCSLNGGMFADRFRVQLADSPATTVTSHISKDGHYYIHFDASQCRSLTVREAARLQSFPDNYWFCGSRTAQYHQVGNAVPPLIARQIATIVADYLG